MANKTVYPYGQDGQLPSGYPIADDLETNSAQQALSAKQGVVLNDKILGIIGEEQLYSLTWVTGDIKTSDGVLNPNYANKSTNYIRLKTSSIIIRNPTAYKIKVARYDISQSFLGNMWVDAGQAKTLTPETSTKYLRLCAYDKPSDEDVANITAGYYSQDTLLSLRQAIDELSNAGSFENPVLKIDNPDPCIINGEDGYFYMLCTGDLATKKMYRSTNLVDWEGADVPFTQQAIADCYSDLGVSAVTFWAAEIVKIGDKYNLYCSKQSTPMLVFQSDHPNFGYEYKGKIITQSNGLANDNIDACVRYDLDGTLWMYWGSTYGIYRQKLSADGLTLDSDDTKVHVAGNLISQDSSRATVFEGAYLYRRKGYWYLFVSAGLYTGNTYCLKVGRSATLTGTFVDKDGNDMAEGNATTILSSVSGDALYGPGHNGQIITDRNNKTFMVYHSHYSGASSTSQRYVCLQEILWDEDGWPYFLGGKPQLYGNVKPQL